MFRLFVIMILGMTSCKRSQTESETYSLSTSVRIAQPKKELSVCWEDSNIAGVTPSIESFASDKVKRQYTNVLTGVYFIEFGRCSVDAAKDIHIRWDNEVSGSGFSNRVGLLKLDSSDTPPLVNLNMKAISEMSQSLGGKIEDIVAETLIHELGHIAGLFHEHSHPDSNCNMPGRDDISEFKRMYPSLMKDVFQSFNRGYDPYSVMSYCKNEIVYGSFDEAALEKIKKLGMKPELLKFGLSINDRQRLKLLYKDKPLRGPLLTGDGVTPVKDDSAKEKPNQTETSGYSCQNDYSTNNGLTSGTSQCVCSNGRKVSKPEQCY